MTARRVSRCFAPLTAALLSACVSAQPAARAPPFLSETQPLAASPAVVQMEPARVGNDEPVCRRQKVTGSHRPRVVCQTAAQRSATRAAAQEWHRTRGRTGEISQVPVVPP
jgi:hypothetical protein